MCLYKALLMSTHNIYFLGGIRKIFTGYPLSRPMWVLDTSNRLSAIVYKVDKFCNFQVAFVHTNPLLKRVYSKRNDSASKRSNSFLRE